MPRWREPIDVDAGRRVPDASRRHLNVTPHHATHLTVARRAVPRRPASTGRVDCGTWCVEVGAGGAVSVFNNATEVVADGSVGRRRPSGRRGVPTCPPARQPARNLRCPAGPGPDIRRPRRHRCRRCPPTGASSPSPPSNRPQPPTSPCTPRAAMPETPELAAGDPLTRPVPIGPAKRSVERSGSVPQPTSWAGSTTGQGARELTVNRPNDRRIGWGPATVSAQTIGDPSTAPPTTVDRVR
jgi:hypothetical protein